MPFWRFHLLIPGMIFCADPVVAIDLRGNQCLSFKSMSSFTESKGKEPGETAFLSRVIPARLAFNELIASWNVLLPADGYLKIEARALYPDHPTKFYTLGLWSRDRLRHP